MSKSFKITYNWEKQSEPYPFDEEDYVDANVLFICLERFLALYEGTFLVRINEFDLHFDLDPDFSIIFEELPGVLQTLMSNTDSPVELYFAEQGTDLNFCLERQADTISIRFVKGLSVGEEYEDLPESVFSIPANVFLNEWVRFANAVLDALVALQPDLTGDQSYQEYRDRLLALEKDLERAGG
jgi:hypothetical protein